MDIYRHLRSLWDKVKKRGRQESHPSNDTQDPTAHMPPYRFEVTQHHSTAYENQHRATEQYYWQEQLRLAKKLNSLTEVLNWITAVGTAFAVIGTTVAVIGLWFLYQTVKITQDQLLTSQRPWVGILDLTTESPLTFDARGGHITVSYTIKNGGNSPAIAIVTETSLFVGSTNDLLKQARHESGCDRDFINAVTKVAGTFLLPGDSLSAKNHEVVTVEPLKTERPQSVWLRICVGYRDQLKEIHGVGLNWEYVTETKTSEFEPRGTLNGTFESRGIFGFMNVY